MAGKKHTILTITTQLKYTLSISPHPYYISYSFTLGKYSPPFLSPKTSKLSHDWCPYWLFHWEKKKSKNENIFLYASKSTNLYMNSNSMLSLLIKCSCEGQLPLLDTKEHHLWYNLFSHMLLQFPPPLLQKGFFLISCFGPISIQRHSHIFSCGVHTHTQLPWSWSEDLPMQLHKLLLCP